MQPLGYSRRHAAEMLGGRSIRHIDRLIATGKLRARGSGKLTTIDHDSLVEYFNSLPVVAGPRALPCQPEHRCRQCRIDRPSGPHPNSDQQPQYRRSTKRLSTGPFGVSPVGMQQPVRKE